MQIELIKCHGSGNDFILIDEMSNKYSFSDQERTELALMLCDRNMDLGADGILFVMNSAHADGRMRIFNADGSEASMCGNGLRIVARYVCEMLKLKNAVIETMKADLKVSKQQDLHPGVETYQVEISPVSFQLSDVPLNIDKSTLNDEKIEPLSSVLRFTALTVPNPHLISIVEKGQLQSDLQKQISEKVNKPNKWFPDGVNVSFVKPLKQNHIYVRTFERGVGFTNACGTAMSASSLVTCLLGYNKVGEVINVYNNGGRAQCIVHKADGKYHIDLVGNATYLYKADITVDLGSKLFTVLSKNEFHEQTIYENLQLKAQKFLQNELIG